MIEQVISGVVGGLCGAYLNAQVNGIVHAYCLANNIEFTSVPAAYIIAAITGAYLFIKWFC